MTTIRNILLPVDFSELSDHAAPFVRSLAESCDAKVHLLHVYVPVAADAQAGVALLPLKATEFKQSLSDFADKHFAGLENPPTAYLAVGRPVRNITEYARENTIDLIVVGTHAKGLLNRIFMGSVSKSVMEHAPCPVLMVPLAASTPALVEA
jgi:universal stress protein A